MDWKFLKRITICIGIVALAIALGTPAFAAKPVPIPQLIIYFVYMDYQNNILHIEGENFNNGVPPEVILDDGTDPLTVNSYNSNAIAATLPFTPSDGSSLLKV